MLQYCRGFLVLSFGLIVPLESFKRHPQVSEIAPKLRRFSNIEPDPHDECKGGQYRRSYEIYPDLAAHWELAILVCVEENSAGDCRHESRR